MYETTITYKDGQVEVEYDSSEDGVEILNVTYKGVNINDILDDKDFSRIEDELYSTLADEAEQARLDMYY
jgi:hypothetical protein